MDDASAQLLRRYQNGDEAAAALIFDRYLARLISLARNRLSPMLERRVDADDVVQSAFRSFFCKARSEDIVLQRAGDLWRLLAAITVNKTLKKVDFHTAQKRDVGKEAERYRRNGKSWQNLVPEAIDREPTPDNAAQIVEELEWVMSGLSARDRRALELRLQGEGVPEIAEELEVAEMTIRRILRRCGRRLSDRLRDDT